MNKKFTSRILSMLLAVLMLISMMPISVFAAPASDIPAEMLDNVFLDALEYTGYKVQAQRDDGTIFKKYSSGATAYLSKISYGLNKYGTETVAKSGTATGLAPDIAGFESSGLCCASFVSYVYYNYLPNIAGIDTSSATRPYNLRTATAYNAAANAWVSAGAARRISFSQNANGNNFIPSEDIPIGSLIISNTFRPGTSPMLPYTAVITTEPTLFFMSATIEDRKSVPSSVCQRVTIRKPSYRLLLRNS